MKANNATAPTKCIQIQIQSHTQYAEDMCAAAFANTHGIPYANRIAKCLCKSIERIFSKKKNSKWT